MRLPCRVGGAEPSIGDTDLGKLAEMARPRQIRRVIRAAIDDGAIDLGAGGALAERSPPDAARAWVELEVASGNAVQAYRLNEAAALLALTRMRTPVAVAVTRSIVRAFILARRGELSCPRQPLALPSAVALKAYDRAAEALAAAVEAGATDPRSAARARLVLVRDLLGAPLDAAVFAPPTTPLALPPALPAGPAEALAAGRAAVVPVVDASGLLSARAVGEPHGASAKRVGELARELGVWGAPDRGSFLDVVINGQVKGRHFAYGPAAVAALTPRLRAEAERRVAERAERSRPGAARVLRAASPSRGVLDLAPGPVAFPRLTPARGTRSDASKALLASPRPSPALDGRAGSSGRTVPRRRAAPPASSAPGLPIGSSAVQAHRGRRHPLRHRPNGPRRTGELQPMSAPQGPGLRGLLTTARRCRGSRRGEQRRRYHRPRA